MCETAIGNLVHTIVHGVSAHPLLAYGTLFLAAFLEAVPALGSLIPGSTIIISLSALIATGDLGLVGVLSSAMLGAAIGDGLAYIFGRRHPQWIHGLWPLTRYPELVRRSERFFHERGSIAIFLARFVPPIRAFLPITAGALGMPPRRFFTFNLAAIAFWGPAHVVPGMLAGTAYHRSGVLGEHLMLPIIAGVIAAGLLFAGYRWLASRNGTSSSSAR